MRSEFLNVEKIVVKINSIKTIFTEFHYCESGDTLDLKSDSDLFSIFDVGCDIIGLIVHKDIMYEFNTKVSGRFKHNGKFILSVTVHDLVKVPI